MQQSPTNSDIDRENIEEGIDKEQTPKLHATSVVDVEPMSVVGRMLGQTECESRYECEAK